MTERKLHYRAAVGPPDKYDEIGALQFKVLVEQGLKEHHKFLDIGCGSLRGGRLFIPYLLPKKYHGIEPDQELVMQGLLNELGLSILQVKKPNFHYSGKFDLDAFSETFDFILAQSIFTHADKVQIHNCLESAKKVLHKNGRFIFTYFQGIADYNGRGWAQSPDAHYTPKWIRSITKKSGFEMRPLNYKHPSGQTWMVLKHATRNSK